MKIGFISDTHGYHKQLTGLDGLDILIHAGDVCMRGTEAEAMNFIDWFNQVEAKHRVFIAGNHDFYFEKVPSRVIRERLTENTFYLNDDGITIEGINIWGSPVQPWFRDWAFNRQRGEDIRRHWDLIPEKTNILITHGPPFGVLDRTDDGLRVGCEDLLKYVERIKPKFHVFGHIHEDYGLRDKEFTSFVNASVLDENYHLVNDPIIVEY
jgi:Icc-related predicted phosphoesterase